MSEYATFINRIKQEVDTADLADRLGLDFDRGRKVAHCFNTNAHANGDRHPSLGFYQRNGEYRYKCFTCGTSGTAIDLYAQVKGVVPLGQSPTGKELIQVCNELGEMYGIKPPQGERRTFKGKNTPKTINLDYKPIAYEQPRVNRFGEYDNPPYQEVYQAFYDACEPPNDDLKEWWHKRGLSDDLLEKAGWRIMTPKTWDIILKQYDYPTLAKAGLVGAYNGQLRHIFGGHNNVIAPLFNGTLESTVARKQPPVLMLRARDIHDKERKDAGERAIKYLQPKGSQLCLYNYNRLYEWLTLVKRPLPPLFIAESETDALAFYEYMRVYEGQETYVVSLEGGGKDENSLVMRELLKAIEFTNQRPLIGVIKDNDEVGDKLLKTIQRAFYKAGWREDKIKDLSQAWASLGLKDAGDYLKYMRENKPKPT